MHNSSNPLQGILVRDSIIHFINVGVRETFCKWFPMSIHRKLTTAKVSTFNVPDFGIV